MRPYWITFHDPPLGWGLGVGVTAIDEEDARSLIEALKERNLVIRELQPVNSVDELEQNHVVPNMGNILKRGVWFPKGYESVA
jgi:hypothetical protein